MQTNKNNEVDQNVPRAYLNYMLFKEDMTYITSGFTQITSGAEDAWETVVIDGAVEIEQSGYAMVYVSNETKAASIVDFDNLEIVHAKTPVVQADDYYPFGLTFNSFTRSYSEKVRFKFQEQEHDEETGWIAFKWRNHQPEIGRFFNVDPLAEKYVYNSPYAFSENRVIDGRELEGLEFQKYLDSFVSSAQKYVAKKAEQAVTYVARETKEFIQDIEVAVYGEAEVEVTSGAQVAGEIKGAGFDVNRSSGVLLSGGVEGELNSNLDAEGGINGDYIGKNGEMTAVESYSAGAVLAGGYRKETTIDSDGNTTSTSTEHSRTAGFGLGATMAVSQEKTKETTTNDVRVGVGAGTKWAFGVGVELSGEIGIKVSHERENYD